MYDDQLIETLRQEQLGYSEWGLDPQTNVKLLTISENATFLAQDPETGRQIVLRVHRPGYQAPTRDRV